GMDPAVRGPRLRRRLGVLVVAEEDARRAVEDLAALVEPDLDVGRRPADGVGADLPVGLHRDVDARLGLTVELLQVHAERAVEAEDLGTDRLACRVADADAAEAESVLERRIDEDAAEPVEQAVGKPDPLAVEDRLADPPRHAE